MRYKIGPLWAEVDFVGFDPFPTTKVGLYRIRYYAKKRGGKPILTAQEGRGKYPYEWDSWPMKVLVAADHLQTASRFVISEADHGPDPEYWGRQLEWLDEGRAFEEVVGLDALRHFEDEGHYELTYDIEEGYARYRKDWEPEGA